MLINANKLHLFITVIYILKYIVNKHKTIPVLGLYCKGGHTEGHDCAVQLCLCECFWRDQLKQPQHLTPKEPV